MVRIDGDPPISYAYMADDEPEEGRMISQPNLALLGADATDDQIDAFVESLLAGATEARKYNPNQPRKPDGKWGSGSGITTHDDPKPPRGGFATQDPTKMANLSAEVQGEIRAQLQEAIPGITEAQMDANLEAVLQRGMADPVNSRGAVWYDEAHDTAKGIADKYDITPEQAAGGIAATSPQHEWGSNVAVAEYTLKAIKEDPTIPQMTGTVTKERTHPETGEKIKVTKTYEEWARDELAKKGITAPDQLVGTKLSDHPPMVQAALIKAMGTSGAWGTEPAGAKLTYADDVTGKRKGATWSCGLNGVETAIHIYNGGDPAVELGGHKVRSFFNNIVDPHGPDSVTVDTHAISAAMNTKIPAQDKRMKALTTKPSRREFGSKGTYPAIADSYRRVAQKYGLDPQQAQAIIWLQWRQENPDTKRTKRG